MATRSDKPFVIERIFDLLWDPAENKLARTMVTMQDIKEAIRWCNEHKGTRLSDSNPANFIKDVIRRKSASQMWPDRLKELRWSAKQVTGDGNVFEFVPYTGGQSEPFETRFGFHPGVKRHKVQSLSIPLASKELGRNDETYIIQVAVKLAVVETHFALESPLKVLELNHLQIGIKLRLCEVDSLFAATYTDESGSVSRMVITCEAKKKGEVILEGQVERQVRAAFEETEANLVAPIAMSAQDGGIYIAEFKAVKRSELSSFTELELDSEAFYELVPPVKGI